MLFSYTDLPSPARLVYIKGMHLYLLELTDYSCGPLDTTQAMLVRAPTPEAARNMASMGRTGDEGHDAWIDPKRTSCTEVGTQGPSGVLYVAVR